MTSRTPPRIEPFAEVWPNAGEGVDAHAVSAKNNGPDGSSRRTTQLPRSKERLNLQSYRFCAG